MKRYTAIVTARGGSKGLLGKNLRVLDGKSLLRRTLDAALGVAAVSHVAVTTDDPDIARESAVAGVHVIDRPAELATDEASSVDTVVHALSVLNALGMLERHFVLLQPTSPMRTSFHLEQCLALLEAASEGSCTVSVCDIEHHPLKALIEHDGRLKPVSGDWNTLHQPRQLLGRACRPNGAIYAMGVEDFLAHRQFLFEPLVPYFMSTEDSVDIDTAKDLEQARKILAARKSL